MHQPSAQPPAGWRTIVFKNRGLLLVPVALVLVIFGKPTPMSATVGIAIAAIGEVIRVWAVGYSGATTRAAVVTAPTLVTAGPYSFVRNPLYVGNALTALGFWFVFAGGMSPLQSVLVLALVMIFVTFVYATIIPLEEAYLAKTFGAQYLDYLARVPRILPLRGALPAADRRGIWRSEVIVSAEMITLLFFALMVAAVIAKLLGIWPSP